MGGGRGEFRRSAHGYMAGKSKMEWADEALSLHARIAELEAENKRLREALRPFAEPHAMGDMYVKFAPRLIEAARAALSQEEKT